MKLFSSAFLASLCIATASLIDTPSLEASLLKKPVKKESFSTYKDLPCSEEDRSKIHEIVSTVGEQGKVSLLLKKSRLDRLGEEIYHVHPLRFLGVIFSDSYLKSCMGMIFKDYFKRKNFMDGLSPSLSREADRGKLDPYLKEFAEEVHTSADTLKPYISSHDWEAMLRHLLQ